MSETQIIKPQAGFQDRVLSTDVDIMILGGAAGCGKSFCLLYEFLRYGCFRPVKNFNSIIFRRQSLQITTTGGLWDKAEELYMKLPQNLQPELSRGRLRANFPTDTTVAFSHLHEEKTVYAYQGAEICYIAFDELTHFSEHQFFYMLSRNRSTCGVAPYVRASTNPQGEGWVKNLVAWWLYPDDHPDENLRGFPIQERQGAIRYFARYANTCLFGDSKGEVLKQLPDEVRGKLPENSVRSFTFVAGLLSENKILMDIDAGYLGNLMALGDNERMQLLEGRWYAKDDNSEKLFQSGEVADIWTNDFVKRGQRYLTADIALEGSDKFVVFVWEGWVVLEVLAFDKTHGQQVLDEINAAARKYTVPQRNICYDSDGVGGYLKGWLPAAKPFHGGGAAIEQPDGSHKKYNNLRSQSYFFAKGRVERSEMYISTPHFRSAIEKELRAITKEPIGADGKIKVSPKSKIKITLQGSPDFADTIAMRSVFDLTPQKRAVPARRVWSA